MSMMAATHAAVGYAGVFVIVVVAACVALYLYARR